MRPLRTFLLVASPLLFGTAANAQQAAPSPELSTFTQQRIRHQKTLGLALGGFALANIAVGAVAAGQTSGQTREFHRMNVYWNLFNLGIAGAGLLGSRKGGDETLAEAVRRHENMKQILLVNAGLDVAYMVGGAYLQERARPGLASSHPNNADQLRGYGKSILFQGGFLLAFDLVNYFVFRNRGDKQERLLLSATPNGLGIVRPLR